MDFHMTWTDYLQLTLRIEYLTDLISDINLFTYVY